MSFNTSTEGVAYQSGLEHSVIWGTVELTALNAFGTVTSCSLTRTADTADIKGRRNETRAFLMNNPGFELDFEALFTHEIEVAEMGSIITFPFVGIQGIIMPGANIKWSNSAARMISFKCRSWDHLASSGTLLYYDGGIGGFLAGIDD